MITQEDLAKKLGVSQVSVSRALRNQKGISEELRRKILDEAEKSGYSIEASNFEARLMRNRGCGCIQRTNIVCAIVTDENDPFGFGGRLLRGINQAAAKDNYDVVIVTRTNGSLPRVVTRRQVDGVIRMLGDIEIAKGVLPCPLPWVSVLYDVPKADLVTVDNMAAGFAIGRLLAASGHRRVAFIGPATHLAAERLEGINRALSEVGGGVAKEWTFLRPYVCNDEPTNELLTEIFSTLQGADGRLPFTAISAYNDFMAELTVRFAIQRGLRVPEDLSVTGFDGALPSRIRETMPLATAAIPLEEIGAEAVRLLRWRLENPDALRRKVALEVVMREGASVRPPPAAGNE